MYVRTYYSIYRYIRLRLTYERYRYTWVDKIIMKVVPYLMFFFFKLRCIAITLLALSLAMSMLMDKPNSPHDIYSECVGHAQHMAHSITNSI